jgi:Zn-dependent peptidase ImmA (M78 family)
MAARIGFAREKARRLLQQAGQNSIPVDLKSICAHLKFEYIEVDHFPGSLSALCVEKGAARYAAVNKNHSSNRKRFSLSHELGHWCLGHTRGYNWSEVTIDHPPDPKEMDAANSSEEKEANEFAGELLVPLAELKKLYTGSTNVNTLAQRFGVSDEVMTIRLIAARIL